MNEQLDILRRIAERGKAVAERKQNGMEDFFIHLLDEIERTKLEYNREVNNG